MKKNFLTNLIKISKSLEQSIYRLNPELRPKKQKTWWAFQRDKIKFSEENLNKLKKLFSSKNIDPKDALEKVKSQLKKISSNSQIKIPKNYQNKLKDAAETSKKMYEQKSRLITNKLEQIHSKLKYSNFPINQKIDFIKQKTQKASQILSSGASSLKQNMISSKQYLGKKSEQIPKRLGQFSQKAYEGLKQNIDVKKKVKKSLNFVFWRIALLISVVAFFYGFGTSLPRQMKHLVRQYTGKSDSSKQESQDSKANKISSNY